MKITHQLQFISEVQGCFNTWKSNDATHYINRRKEGRNDHLPQCRKASGSIYHCSMNTALRKPRSKEKPLILIKYISWTKTKAQDNWHHAFLCHTGCSPSVRKKANMPVLLTCGQRCSGSPGQWAWGKARGQARRRGK